MQREEGSQPKTLRKKKEQLESFGESSKENTKIIYLKNELSFATNSSIGWISIDTMKWPLLLTGEFNQGI
jgi:hypothetical protein